MYALPESCPFTGLFIPNPIYSTTPTGSRDATIDAMNQALPPFD
ncbi:hypothetical protein [Serratia symbiotica]